MSKITELREARGLTQYELAKLVDVDTSTIRNLEKGRSGIQALVRVANLCKALQCQAEDLIEYVEVEETAMNKQTKDDV